MIKIFFIKVGIKAVSNDYNSSAVRLSLTSGTVFFRGVKSGKRLSEENGISEKHRQ